MGSIRCSHGRRGMTRSSGCQSLPGWRRFSRCCHSANRSCPPSASTPTLAKVSSSRGSRSTLRLTSTLARMTLTALVGRTILCPAAAKWLNAVAWAGGDLLTAISGIVTIVLIFQHQLFEQDLGEPDSTRFLFLSCMYGLDVVYQLVFLKVLCLGCSACTGHSNGKKPDKSEIPQDQKPLISESP